MAILLILKFDFNYDLRLKILFVLFSRFEDKSDVIRQNAVYAFSVITYVLLSMGNNDGLETLLNTIFLREKLVSTYNSVFQILSFSPSEDIFSMFWSYIIHEFFDSSDFIMKECLITGLIVVFEKYSESILLDDECIHNIFSHMMENLLNYNLETPILQFFSSVCDSFYSQLSKYSNSLSNYVPCSFSSWKTCVEFIELWKCISKIEFKNEFVINELCYSSSEKVVPFLIELMANDGDENNNVGELSYKCLKSMGKVCWNSIKPHVENYIELYSSSNPWVVLNLFRLLVHYNGSSNYIDGIENWIMYIHNSLDMNTEKISIASFECICDLSIYNIEANLCVFLEDCFDKWNDSIKVAQLSMSTIALIIRRQNGYASLELFENLLSSVDFVPILLAPSFFEAIRVVSTNCKESSIHSQAFDFALFVLSEHVNKDRSYQFFDYLCYLIHDLIKLIEIVSLNNIKMVIELCEECFLVHGVSTAILTINSFVLPYKPDFFVFIPRFVDFLIMVLTSDRIDSFSEAVSSLGILVIQYDCTPYSSEICAGIENVISSTISISTLEILIDVINTIHLRNIEISSSIINSVMYRIETFFSIVNDNTQNNNETFLYNCISLLCEFLKVGNVQSESTNCYVFVMKALTQLDSYNQKYLEKIKEFVSYYVECFPDHMDSNTKNLITFLADLDNKCIY